MFMKKLFILMCATGLTFSVATAKEGKKKSCCQKKAATTCVKPTEVKVGNPADVKAASGPFQIENLQYGYADLEKAIDKETMEIHFSKHYLGYTNNLNKAVEGKSIANQSIEEILKNLDMSNGALRNNGGGFYNHRMYFATMSPNGGGTPTGKLAEAINQTFGSFDALKKQLEEAGAKRFGSGWAWLFVNKQGKLQVGSTANQDNPLMPGLDISGTPILGIDVWEHAYYLKYQNKRNAYLDALFSIVDWNKVADNYAKAIAQ